MFYGRYKKLVKMHQSIHVIQCNDDVHILWKLQKSMKGKTNNWASLFEFNFATFFPILLDTLVDLLCCCKQDFLLRIFQFSTIVFSEKMLCLKK